MLFTVGRVHHVEPLPPVFQSLGACLPIRYLASFSHCGQWAMANAHQGLKPLPNLLRHTEGHELMIIVIVVSW